jgi:hypothetical protein
VAKRIPIPVIVSADDGLLSNAVALVALKESGCSFVYLSPGWADLSWDVYASNLIRVWVKVIEALQTSNRQVVIEVGAGGSIRRTNL